MTRLIPTTVLTSLLALAACGDDGTGVGDGGTSGFDAAGGGRDTGASSLDGRVGVDVSPGPGSDLCPGGSQCTDGMDNDGDGMVDGFDVECTGVCDDDEGSFATGIPGDNRDPMWQDCFYDGNSGAGDDGCRYRTECLTGELPASDRDCMLSMECIDFCGSRTPNGCDCFGCCEIITGSSSVFITLGPECSIETIGDPTACPPCVQSTECVNECGECEICPGRTAADLPASCRTDGGMGYECDMGTTCAVDADCPTDYYCSLGCCLPFII